MYKFILLFKKTEFIYKVDGITYQLNLNEMIDFSIYYFGCYKKNTYDAIRKLCQKGMVALDIGANIGAYTFKMAQLVGETGRVIAIEPMKWAFNKLKQNMRLNNFQNLIIEKIALSNESKKELTHFKSSWLKSGTSDERSKKKEIIQFSSLDEYLKNTGIDKVQFIKLDVDGYEFNVLQGAIKTLRRDKPKIILELGIETAARMNISVTEIISFLLDLDYKFYSIKTFKKFPNIITIINSIPATLDIIASIVPL